MNVSSEDYVLAALARIIIEPEAPGIFKNQITAVPVVPQYLDRHFGYMWEGGSLVFLT